MFEVDRLFDILKGNAFRGDPNQIPQESIPAGGGNAQPVGWYAGHGFSSALGQKNFLEDPTFETIPHSGVNIGTAETAAGPHWATHYVLVSGSAPGSVQAVLGADRLYFGNNFNSCMLEIYAEYAAAAAVGKVEIYAYPDTSSSGLMLDANKLAYIVASIRLTRLTNSTFTNASATCELEIQENVAGTWTTRATCPTQDANDIGGSANTIRTFVTAFAVAASNANNWRPRIKIVLEKTATAGAAQIFCDFGEPILSFSHIPEAPPFMPSVGAWYPVTLSWGLQTITGATATILPRRMVVALNPNAVYTLTSTPTIPDGSRMQVVTLLNVSANNLTLQDQGTLANSNLRLTAATLTLAPRQSIQLMFSTEHGDWIQTGNLVAVL